MASTELANVRAALEEEWAEFMVATNVQGKKTNAETWRLSNPGEWQKLSDYREKKIARPSLATSFGRQMVEHVDAYHLTETSDPPDPPPPPPPSSDAPARSTTITAQSGLTAQNDTRYIDCPGLSIPSNVQRITVIGSQFPTTQLKGVKDVWIEGRPNALMNAGPRTDGGDLLQVKMWPVSGGTPVSPDDITLRWIRFHDVSRPSGSSAHPDGIQVMAGKRGRILSCRFESCDVQPIFLNHSGSLSAGGGEITDWLIEDCYIDGPPTGFYAINVGPNSTPADAERISKRCVVKNCRVAKNVRIGQAAVNNGCTAVGTMNLDGSPRNPAFVIG